MKKPYSASLQAFHSTHQLSRLGFQIIGVAQLLCSIVIEGFSCLFLRDQTLDHAHTSSWCMGMWGLFLPVGLQILTWRSQMLLYRSGFCISLLLFLSEIKPLSKILVTSWLHSLGRYEMKDVYVCQNMYGSELRKGPPICDSA